MTSGRSVPRLALVYHPASFSVFQLMEAAHGLCELVWVVDGAVYDSAVASRMLRRFGTVLDVTGLDAERAAAALTNLRADGIITFKDERLRFTAELADRAGLRFHTPAVTVRLTDKYAQREALREAGLPVPVCHPVPCADDASGWAELVSRSRFPSVLKPRRESEASRDTVMVATLEELRAHLAGAGSPQMVLEEYLADRTGAVRPCFADYVSVESVVCGGRISHLAINGRFPPAEPFRESGFFIEAELDHADRLAALDCATAALRAVGIEDGCCHTEVKFTPAGARVIEVNGRIGGGVPEMLGDITDVELLKDAMRIALGQEVRYDRPVAPERVGFLFYVHAPRWMRRVTNVQGLEQLSQDPRVTETILNRGPGQLVDWREGNHGHVYSVRGTVADHDELERMHRRVHAEVRITGSETVSEAPAPLTAPPGAHASPPGAAGQSPSATHVALP